MVSISLLLSLVFVVVCNAATCQAPATADSSPANPGIPPAELTAAVAGRPLVDTSCAEIVTVYKQDAFNPAVAWPRTNCPHQRTDLVNFESLFPNLQTGQSAVLTAGQKALFRACSVADGVVLQRIQVLAGAVLVFQDEDISLQLRELRVEEGGEIYAGSATCPLFSKLTITLRGSRADSTTTNWDPDLTKTSKGILIGGRGDFHGKRYAPTWTRLARTANAGDSIIFVSDNHNWEVGQEVLLLTTAYYDCPDNYKDTWCKPCPDWQTCTGASHQNERRFITAISSNCASNEFAIKLSAPLTFSHYSGREYQGEVALLSRRIQVIGENSGDQFGAHTLVSGKASVRMTGVQVSNGGQARVMARYPFHFHMLGETTDCLFDGNVVVDSNFRAYTIHGSNATKVTRNIAYNVQGFAYYLEDAVEEKNEFHYNMAAHVHPIDRPANGDGGQGGETFNPSATLLLPADASASGFYISNAFNDFLGNVASGGWSGFAFPNIPKPIGKHAGQARPVPAQRPTRLFRGNTAHSSGFYWRAHGSCIYTGANLESTVANPTPTTEKLQYISGRFSRNTIDGDTGAKKWMVFEDVRVWACKKGIAHWGDRLEAFNLEFHDIGISAMLFGQAALMNAVVNVRSQNPTPETQLKGRGETRWGFQFYDTWVQIILSQVTFRGFKAASKDAVLRYMDHSDQFLPQGINTVAGIKFEDCDVSTRLVLSRCGPTPQSCADSGSWSMSSRMEAIWDWDGSLSQTGQPTIFGSNIDWWNVDNTCSLDSTLAVPLWKCQWTQNRQVGYIQAKVPGLMEGCDGSVAACNGQNAAYTVGTMRQFNNPRSIAMSPWPGVTGIANTGWHWRVLCQQLGINGAPSQFSIEDPLQLARGHFIVLSVTYPAGTTFDVSIRANWAGNTLWSMPMANKADVLSNTEVVKDPASVTCTSVRGNIPNWSPFCDLGGVGPAWHFDGQNLFLRIVNVACYNGATRKNNCENALYAPSAGPGTGGVTGFNQNQAFTYLVKATCNGCTVQSSYKNVNFFQVTDNPPVGALNINPGPLRAPVSRGFATSKPCGAPATPAVCGGVPPATTAAPATTTAAPVATTTAAPATTTAAAVATTTAAPTTTVAAGGTTPAPATTTAAPATTTAAPTTTKTTVVAGGTTPTPATTAAGGGTTAAPVATTTSAAAVPQTTTPAPAPGSEPTPKPVVPVAVACPSVVPYVPVVTRRLFKLRFTVNPDQFNCNDALSSIAKEINTAVSELQVHDISQGSTWISVSSNNDASPLFTRLGSNSLVNFNGPNVAVLEGVDQNGNAVRAGTTSSGFPMWAIIVASVIGGLILLAIIVIVIILVIRYKNRHPYPRQSAYAPLHNEPLHQYDFSRRVSSGEPIGFAPAPTANAFLTATVLADHYEPGAENALPVQKGSVVTVETRDWKDTSSPWVWCQHGSASGYVPRFVLLVQEHRV